MAKKIFTLPLLSLPLLALALHSCRKDHSQEFAQSGLRASRIYYCDTVLHDVPMRMFTQAGEVTDAGIIGQYLALRPQVAGAPGAASERHPFYIQSTLTTEVRLNGLEIYTGVALPGNGTFAMRRRDTSRVGIGGPTASIDVVYPLEQQFRAIRDAVLQMNGSYSKLERVDSQNYIYRESFRINGTYANEVIVLPYTFIASRFLYDCYPFAVKSGVVPQVPAGDTLLVQEGRVEFKLRQ